MKTCTKCGLDKADTDYYKNGKSGYHTYCKTCFDNGRRLHKFGLTTQDFEEMHIAQNYECALCGSPDPGGRKAVKTFMIDHCHATGKVRGLLCHSCNLLLGHAKDNVQTLQNAIDYLRKHMQ